VMRLDVAVGERGPGDIYIKIVTHDCMIPIAKVTLEERTVTITNFRSIFLNFMPQCEIVLINNIIKTRT
jgi:hypothetical protein